MMDASARLLARDPRVRPMRPEGLREDLRRGAPPPGHSLLHREREGVVLDQEIPIEGLMDLFDSAAGEH